MSKTLPELDAATSIESADLLLLRKSGDTVDKKGTAGLLPISALTQTALDLKANQSSISNIDNTSDADKPVSTATQTALDLKITPTQAAAGTDNDQTGTTYPMVLTDQENKTIQRSNASDHTTTIPLNASIPFPIGTKINVIWDGGAGIPTIDVSTGVTINGVLNGSFVINNVYQGTTLTKRGTNNWTAAGDIGTVA